VTTRAAGWSSSSATSRRSTDTSSRSSGIERAQVIIDRRFGLRRRLKRPYPTDRRRTPRERRAQHEIDAELRTSGIVFVRLASTPAPVTPAHRAEERAPAASSKRAPRSWLRWRARLLR